jgi:hydroxyacylglutathione hydrolase
MLEDEFCDVLRKALRGTGLSTGEIASRTALGQAELSAWLRGDGSPSEDAARAIARVLRLDPGKLAAAAAARPHPGAQLPADISHHPNDPHPSNGYFFFLESAKSAALIDPAGHSAAYLDVLANGPFALRYILITHKHADHCDATAEVARRFPGAEIVMHRADASAIGPLAAKATPIVDGDELPFGDGVSIRMLHTPGHTDGSSCFLIRSNLFSGDTLFAGSVGGVFGERYGYDDLLNGVGSKLFTLPDETVVLPGHGPPSTIGEERAHNPFF